jgi:hypothetical protein
MTTPLVLPNLTPTAPSPGMGGSFLVQEDGTLLRTTSGPADPAPADPAAPAMPAAPAAPAMTGESIDPYPQE